MTPSEAQEAISASRKAILENLNTGGKETALLGAISQFAQANGAGGRIEVGGYGNLADAFKNAGRIPESERTPNPIGFMTAQKVMTGLDDGTLDAMAVMQYTGGSLVADFVQALGRAEDFGGNMRVNPEGYKQTLAIHSAAAAKLTGPSAGKR